MLLLLLLCGSRAFSTVAFRSHGVRLPFAGESSSPLLHARMLPPRAAAAPLLASALSPPVPQLEQLALLGPALTPIVGVISFCLLGMLPSGLKALISQSDRRKLHRRIFTGFTLGVLVSLWIFSGTWPFLSVFALSLGLRLP